jgi:hypothetical protein
MVNGYGAALPNDPSTDRDQQNAGARPTFLNQQSPDDVEILEQLYGTRKKLRIAIMGCGISAINLFKRFEERMKNIEIICYEKNDDVGGTWYENSKTRPWIYDGICAGHVLC